MRHARATARHHTSSPHLDTHEPSLADRLEFARDCLRIARFAAGSGMRRTLARREVSRARSEVMAVTRTLDVARRRSRLFTGRADPEIVALLGLSRRLARELRASASRISRMN